METLPRCCTNGRALPRDIRHKVCYLAMNSDPKLSYRYSAFSLTLLSNSEQYCRQWKIGLPVIIDEAAPEGTLQHHIYGIHQMGGRREQMCSGMKRSWAVIPVGRYDQSLRCASSCPTSLSASSLHHKQLVKDVLSMSPMFLMVNKTYLKEKNNAQLYPVSLSHLWNCMLNQTELLIRFQYITATKQNCK